LEWLAQNWHIPWALICLGAIVVAFTRYRQTAPVRFLAKLWLWLTGFAVGVAVLGMLLMAIGVFTVEWTCECGGPDHWKCKGPQCDAEAQAHFAKFKHPYSCARTDWPMRVLAGVGRVFIPE
jgi:hypothetical protein